MTDRPPPHDPVRIELPPPRGERAAGVDGAGAGPPAGPGGPPDASGDGHYYGGGNYGTRRQARRRGLVVLLAGAALVACLVVVVMGPVRDKFRSVLGDGATTTTAAGPVAVQIPPGFRLANIINRYHARLPNLSTESMRTLLTDGQITSTLLPPGGVPASVLPPHGSAMEGLLKPSAYSVPPGASARLVLNNMVTAMERDTQQLGIAEASARLKLTPYQIMTVASMVQAESGNPDEAPKIARVIYNRLAADEPLGVDATSKYLKCVTSLDENVCQSPLTEADFKVDSPYNTRIHRGLPPTPIGAPGDSALRAAMHPADGPWRFYVRDVQRDPQGRAQHRFFADNSSPDYVNAVEACKATQLGC